MGKIKIKRFTKGSNSLNEIYQKSGIYFSYCTSAKNGRAQCHEWVKCRDYLNDVIRTALTGWDTKIYGFSYSKENNPMPDLTKMRMLVTKQGMSNAEEVTAFRKKIRHALMMVNHFEKMAKLSLSKVWEVDLEGYSGKKKPVFMFYGSGIWLKSPFLVSMYTYLIRLGDKEFEFKDNKELKKRMEALGAKFKKGEASVYKDVDAKYAAELWNRLELIMKHRKVLFPAKERGFHELYFNSLDINTFHNQTGIVSLVREESASRKANIAFMEVVKKHG